MLNPTSQVTLTVDGRSTTVDAGITVSAALQSSGRLATRRSPRGESRGPLCGMGVCFECRVTVDGRAHQRGCRVQVQEGMLIETGVEDV